MQSAECRAQVAERGTRLAPSLFALLVVLALAAGCRSVSVTPGDAPQKGPGRIAFMPIDDSGAWRGVSDYLFTGSTGARGGSAALSRALGAAFAAQGWTVVADEDVRRKLWEMQVSPEEACRADDALLRKVGAGLQADALVTGHLAVCKRTWVLFFPWASVEFTLRAFDAASGKTLWTASAKVTRVWKHERDVFQDAAKEIATRATNGWRTDP